jgi:hypothetical protein
MKAEKSDVAAWFAEISRGWEPPNDNLTEVASGYDNLHSTWGDTDSSALLVWLAARFAADLTTLGDVIETTRLLVQQHLVVCRRAQLDATRALSKLTSGWLERADQGGWLERMRDSAEVCRLASESALALSGASMVVINAKNGSSDETSALKVREVPALLSLAVTTASAAYASYYMAQGAPFAIVPEQAELVCSRHRLEKDGTGAWRTVSGGGAMG